MKILTVLTYYRPYTSGLTIYAERLSHALQKRGHSVTVLAMRHEPDLMSTETVDGVVIERADVLLRVSKGIISPSFWWRAAVLAKQHDIIHLHLPQFDAAIVAFFAKLFGKKVVITYHCDLLLPKSAFNSVVNFVVNVMNSVATYMSDRVITYTEDYANTSAYARKFKNKLTIIPPPVELPRAEAEDISQFAATRLPQNRPLIGMAARLAAEKGVEVLIGALEKIRSRYPEASVVFAGQYQDVLGEAEYFQRIKPLLENYQKMNAWYFLGTLSPKEMACFFPNLDILVVPSLNSTESFGMVQIEAMMNSVPVVPSNLPGVRQPVLMTGMGRVSEIGDSNSLAEEVLKVLDERSKYLKDPEVIRKQFSPEKNAMAYEELYSQLLKS